MVTPRHSAITSKVRRDSCLNPSPQIILRKWPGQWMTWVGHLQHRPCSRGTRHGWRCSSSRRTWRNCQDSLVSPILVRWNSHRNKLETLRFHEISRCGGHLQLRSKWCTYHALFSHPSDPSVRIFGSTRQRLHTVWKVLGDQ